MSYSSYRILFQSTEQCAKALYDNWRQASAKYYEEQANLVELVEAVGDLLANLNVDKDDSFFLCKEAAPIVDRVRELVK